MNDLLLDIDDFFEGHPNPQQRKQFEERLKNDPEFAREVAFYLGAKQTLKEEAKEEKKKRFRALFDEQQKTTTRVVPMNSIRKYAVAAAIIGVLALSWFLFRNDSETTKQFADRYVQQNYGKLSVSMGSQDSLQLGLNLYNSGKFNESLQQFEGILQNNPNATSAMKFAGLAALQLHQYDKALNHFSRLANYPGLFANAGVFLQAITLSKRNLPGDQQRAKELMQQVVKDNLGERKGAEDFLRK